MFQETLNAVMPDGAFGDRDAYNRTWAHSAAVSACAGYLGKNVFQLSEYELGTMGLLHDIGKYFFHILEPQSHALTDVPLLIGEERRYGIHHASLGSRIANNWQLSEGIVKSIEYHHRPVS